LRQIIIIQAISRSTVACLPALAASFAFACANAHPAPLKGAIYAVNLAVAQSQKYEGDNWWKWSLWIEGTDEDLDRIHSVTYRLHSTFPEPMRTVTDRASKFQLRCSGWGIFLIPVKVRLKDGKTIDLMHQLQFAIPRNVREDD
jgi:hypothetical protein